jgi:hypothetical protein
VISYLFAMRVRNAVPRLRSIDAACAGRRASWLRGAMFATSLLVYAGTATLGACNHMERRYLSPEGASVYAMAFAPDTPPLVAGEGAGLYLLETPIEIPIRPPTTAEQAALGELPWVRRGDYELDLTFTVRNLDTSGAHFVTVTLNGVSPEYEYVPGVVMEDGEAVPDFAQWERTYALGPGESRTVTVREEEISEIGVDLASATSSPACEQLANSIVYFMNQSGIEPRTTACVPPIVPGLVALKLGLRAFGGPPPIVLEASARVRDVRDRIASPGQPEWTPPTPRIFTPPAPPES